jgi:hypothetical protein
MTAPTDIPLPAHPRLLKAARVFWLFYAAGILVLHLVSLPGYFAQVSAGTVPEDMLFDENQPTGNAYFATRAATAGLSIDQYLVANKAASLFVIAVHYFVAALIFWRLPRSWFGLLSAYVILLTGSAAIEDAFQASGLSAQLPLVIRLLFNLGALVWPIFALWLYLFPDGKAIPRWARWPIGLSTALFAALMVAALLDSAGLLPPAAWQAVTDFNARYGILVVVILPGLLLALASQVYRYWRVSGALERQQTKWFLFGLAFFISLFFLGQIFPFVNRVDAISGSLGLTIIPITVGIALVRYRLWDVDVVVRRTVGYAVLTALLLLIYFGSIVVLQRLFSDLTGEDSTLATILSTLLIAALFLPLRRRIQDAIDRRFFRGKYDATKVLGQFAATARDETDLDTLTAELLRVIQETMQPEHISLWLREELPPKRGLK